MSEKRDIDGILASMDERAQKALELDAHLKGQAARIASAGSIRELLANQLRAQLKAVFERPADAAPIEKAPAAAPRSGPEPPPPEPGPMREQATSAPGRVCPKCRAALKPAAKFCGSCGTPFTAAAPPEPAVPACPGCGSPMRPGAKFCGSCGRRFA
jgi:hypothetical protein